VPSGLRRATPLKLAVGSRFLSGFTAWRNDLRQSNGFSLVGPHCENEMYGRMYGGMYGGMYCGMYGRMHVQRTNASAAAASAHDPTIMTRCPFALHTLIHRSHNHYTPPLSRSRWLHIIYRNAIALATGG